MRLYSTLLLLIVIVVMSYGQSVKSPKEFLPTDFGKEFTPHHEIINYINHVAANSPRVKVVEYGRTNEDRPLVVCFISSPENLVALEDIRLTNLQNIGLANAQPTQKKEAALVWMSFDVHGNEAACTESAVQILYDLVDPKNSKSEAYLKNTVVIIDPVLNPDGFARYTNWIRSTAGKRFHPDLEDREHMEPWPGGRVNHYLFDLNRDWAWLTQKESQARIELYNKWMPHVHADFHEMGYNSQYYFAPAAKPYHEQITKFQRDFQTEIGKNHAKYFDQKGWLYFTRETFDLFYPSYGDTYPTYNGAIGMTYEQAGNSSAGRAIKLNNGKVLTLQDRIDHHVVTGLSTVEISSQNTERLIKEFNQYFKNPSLKGKFKSYLLKASPKTDDLALLLSKHDIKFTKVGAITKKPLSNVYHYQSMSNKSAAIETGDIIISAKQTKGLLTQVLLEPHAHLEDSLTYDITAWSLPYAYGVEAYGLVTDEIVNGTNQIDVINYSVPRIDQCYAALLPWETIGDIRTLAKLHDKGLKIRSARKDLSFGNIKVKRGAMVLTKGDNEEEFLNWLVAEKIAFQCLYTGFADGDGPGDISGNSFELLTKPKVLTIMGEKTSNYEVGHVWHYFDEVIEYPLSMVNLDRLGSVNFDNFTHIVLSDGYYSLDKNLLEKITKWVEKGGRLISIGGANYNFAEAEGYALKKFATDDEKSAVVSAAKEKDLRNRTESFDEGERKRLSNALFGAIIENKLDMTHPLSFGLGSSYYSLKTDGQYYKLLKGVSNPIYVPKNYKSTGFIGSELRPQLEETSNVAVERKGRGEVIYLIDNPLFRGFWMNGLMLFGNALFMEF